jgi:heptosyltransferase-2
MQTVPAEHTQPRILVIRGGAIGDFILTLPAIGLLREAFPHAHLEILGYRHIVALAEGRSYADAARSIEYAGMASFFIPGGTLPPELVDYFAGFQLVVSYLYDPERFFQTNLERAGVKHLVSAYSKIGPGSHAVRQLARPLESLALFLEDEAMQPRVVLHPSDRQSAAALWAGVATDASPWIAIHPGSGGKTKCWPPEHWAALSEAVRRLPGEPSILWVGGEADLPVLEALRPLRRPQDRLAWNLPLPQLGAVLERAQLFLGHDSGISHLAAAVGTPCLLLFGPTDPAVWAPPGMHARVLQAEGLGLLEPSTLLAEVSRIWAAMG